MSTNSPSRRDVLTALSAGGAALCLVPLGGCDVGPLGPISAGNLSDLVVGELVAVSGEMVAIGLDADGLYAVTTICTHLSCDMSDGGSVSATEISCVCHGSTFDGAGQVTGGPATAPLEFYAVSVDDDGEVTIEADEVVDAAARTAV